MPDRRPLSPRLERPPRNRSRDPFADLDAATPIALLPVRLETRWFPVAADPARIELRIRVFPDEIHLADEMGATALERLETAKYWSVRNHNGEEAESTRAAWRRLSEMFGVGRAAWLVRTLAGAAPSSADPPASTLRPVGLPDRWHAVARAPGFRAVATGAAIPPELAAGPVPNDSPGSPALPALGAALIWVVDFAAAESSGMALRLTMLKTDADRLDELIVVGVRESESPEAGAGMLGDLIARHALGHGAALVAPGTPTNYTDDILPPENEVIGTVAAESDAGRLASALGIPREALRDATADAINRDAIVRDMHAVLWPATWGYFLETLLPRTPAAIARGRALFVDRVRPLGPLPAMRVGNQPYGVLPATSLAHWPAAGPDGEFASVLRRIAERLRTVPQAPRLVDSNDLDRDLVAVLRRSPISIGSWVRPALDRDAAAVHIGGGGVFGINIPDVGAAAQALADAVAGAVQALGFIELGITGPMPVLDLVFDDRPRRLGIPLVAPGGVARDQPLPANYLQAIADATTDDLANHRLAGADPRTLLYLLARHAATRLRVTSADTVLGTTTAHRIDRVDITSPRRLGIHSAVLDLSNATLPPADEPPPPAPARAPVWGRLNRVALEVVFEDPRVAAHRTALRHLATAPVGELELACAAALDAASHRLDAWITALANDRLIQLRAGDRRATYLGGWAWLERPRPRPPGADDDPGFIHAPSTAQARTAAILRAGYEAHRSEQEGQTLAIDLSAPRVSAARRLLDAIRAGHSLSRLLGDQIEAWLGERDQTRIAAVRAAFARPGQPLTEVVDGWRVHQQWTSTPPTHAVDAAVASQLIELFDAVSDLLLAESVHQAVAGSPSRVAAALDVLERGEIATPDPEVDRSSSDGPHVRHRVVLALDDRPGWTTSVEAARAAAAPRLEGWAAAVLGNPAQAAFVVELIDETGTIHLLRRTVADLDLCALDVVAVVGRGSDEGLKQLVAATVPAGIGTLRSVIAEAGADDLVLRAAAVGRVISASRSPARGDLGSIQIAPAADRAGAVAAAVSALAPNGQPRVVPAAALLGVQFAVHPELLPAAIASLETRVTAPGADSIREVLGPATAVPMGIGSLPAPLATDGIEFASWLGDIARGRAAMEPIDLLALVAGDAIGGHRTRTDDGVEVTVFGFAQEQQPEVIVIDGWSEAAPASEVSTGVGFRFDAPRSQPAQSILIAVPPPGTSWSLPLLEAIVDETIDLAQLRLLAPSDVHNHVLPAIYLADDPDELTVSNDLLVVAVDLVREAIE